MAFSTIVSDISYRDRPEEDNRTIRSSNSIVGYARSARSLASTAATGVSIAGSISSQLHGGYGHSLTRAWQSERQLTKVSMYHGRQQL